MLWRTYRRTGGAYVSRILTEDWQWTPPGASDPLTGHHGDIVLTDGAGAYWAISPEAFARTYEQPTRTGWAAKKGRVQARPALPGEVVASREGTATAPPGAYVVRDDAGEQWFVPADRFASAYALDE